MGSYLWDTSDDYPESCIGQYDKEKSPDRFELRQGKRLADDFGPVIFRFRQPARELQGWDCLENNALVPLIGPRAFEALSKIADTDVQALTTRVHTSDGELDGYRAINIVRVIQCADLERSRFKKIVGSDRIMKFTSLRHRPNCLGDHHIAREFEYLSHIIVSDVIREIFSRAHITGVRFIKSDEVR